MKVIEVKDFAKGICIAIVVTRFNSAITQALLQGAAERLQELEVNSENMTAVYVPTAREIPLTVKQLTVTGKYQAVIVLGAILQSDVDYDDGLCKQINKACQQVALEYDTPIISGILTANNADQAKEYTGGKKGHKGREVADITMEMISVLQQIS